MIHYSKLLLIASLALTILFPIIPTTHAQVTTGQTTYPWPMIYGNYQRTGFQNGSAPSTPHLLWRAGPMGGVPSWGVAIAEGKIFQGCYVTGDVYAWDQNTGDQLWHQNLNNTAYGVMYYNGKIYTSGGSMKHDPVARITGDEWVCLDAANGNIEWIWKIPQVINGVPQNISLAPEGYLMVMPSQPTVYRDTLWVKVIGGYAFLDPDTGVVESYLINGDVSTGFPAFEGDRYFGVDAAGSAYCLDINTLQMVWRSSTLSLGGSYVTVSAGQVYISGGDGNITRIDATTGGIVWEFPWTARISTKPPAVSLYGPPPCISYKRILFGSVEGVIYSVDQFTDTSAQWKFQTGAAIYSQPAIADGKFYTGSSDGSFYCVDTSGNLVWKYDIGYQVSGSCGIADGKVYTAANDQYMYCFGPAPASYISLSTPTSITVDQTLTVTGTLVNETGAGITGTNVRLKYRVTPGIDWKNLTTITTTTDGSYSYTWTPPYDGYYDISAYYPEPEIGGYAFSSASSTVRVIPTTPEIEVDITEITDALSNLDTAVDNLQTYLIATLILVIGAIAVSAVAVIYSRRKSK